MWNHGTRALVSSIKHNKLQQWHKVTIMDTRHHALTISQLLHEWSHPIPTIPSAYSGELLTHGWGSHGWSMERWRWWWWRWSPPLTNHLLQFSGIRNSVLAPCRDGELEEIIAIIIATASPSTNHASPIHVWVIHRCRLKGMVGIGWDHSCNRYKIIRAWCLVSVVSTLCHCWTCYA